MKLRETLAVLFTCFFFTQDSSWKKPTLTAIKTLELDGGKCRLRSLGALKAFQRLNVRICQHKFQPSDFGFDCRAKEQIKRHFISVTNARLNSTRFHLRYNKFQLYVITLRSNNNVCTTPHTDPCRLIKEKMCICSLCRPLLRALGLFGYSTSGRQHATADLSSALPSCQSEEPLPLSVYLPTIQLYTDIHRLMKQACCTLSVECVCWF